MPETSVLGGIGLGCSFQRPR